MTTQVARPPLLPQGRRVHGGPREKRRGRLVAGPIRAIDEQIAASERTIADAQALVAEWDGASDLEAAAETYSEVQALAHGGIAQARGAQAVSEALREVLSGMWLAWDPVAERVLGELTPCALSRPPLLSPPGRWPTSSRPRKPRS